MNVDATIERLARAARGCVSGAGPDALDRVAAVTLALASARALEPSTPVSFEAAARVSMPEMKRALEAMARRGSRARALLAAIDALDLTPEDALHELYEGLLAVLAPATRASRGVYVTPAPLVHFVVASAAALLRDELALDLARDVRVVDPATGTGRFLAAVIDRAAIDGARPDDLVALARRLTGLDVLLAPLAAAAFHVRRALARAGAPPTLDVDLRRANALDQGAMDSAGAPLLVLGNPPYSASSANRGAYDAIVAPYRTQGGRPLGERKTWLHDDYVKFFRRAEEAAARAPSAVVAFVTNHGWLENPTFRGMRESLLATFPIVRVLDLHGGANKRERAAGGGADENVFAIRQGVAIALLARPRRARASAVVRADLFGTRVEKLGSLETRTLASMSPVPIAPRPPTFAIALEREHDLPEAARAFALDAIFPARVAGIVTARDRVVTDVDAGALLTRIALFRGARATDDELRARFFRARVGARHPPGDTRGFSLARARAELRRDRAWRTRVRSVLVAPFDVRAYYADPRFVDWPREPFLASLDLPDNIALLAARAVEIRGPYEHAFVTRVRALHHAVSRKEVNYVFPLFVDQSGARVANLGLAFARALAATTGVDAIAAPERVLAYVYALLASRAYRTRFDPLLREDFAKIPLARSGVVFDALADLGARLVRAHLLEDGPSTPAREIPADVDDFSIGGTRVARAWLKARAHLAPARVAEGLGAIVAAARTSRGIEAAIDRAILDAGGFPGAFAR